LSNLNDLLKAVSTTNADGTAKARDAVDAIGSSMGFLADVSGVVGFLDFASSLVNTILGKDDEVTQRLNKLQQEIQILQLNGWRKISSTACETWNRPSLEPPLSCHN
jgi:hypothetical protein